MTIKESSVKKLHAVAALAVAATLALAGCGGTDEGSQTVGEFNKADVTFAQEMIPHHQQAIEMAQLVETRSQEEEVQRLAAQIESAQDPEIKRVRLL
jgi:uncharacterized protein (DUF305 family)